MPSKWVVHCKREPFDIYIGRPSKWGNPFTHGTSMFTGMVTVVHSRDVAIQSFKEHISKRPEFLEQVKKELKGKVLGCWCAPRPCHGDVLAEIANEE